MDHLSDKFDRGLLGAIQIGFSEEKNKTDQVDLLSSAGYFLICLVSEGYEKDES
jgi:hypothetical protein